MVRILLQARGGADILRIPTGIFNLDAEIGGGIPYGQVTMFVGKESGGKSLTALKTASKRPADRPRDTRTTNTRRGALHAV